MVHVRLRIRVATVELSTLTALGKYVRVKLKPETGFEVPETVNSKMIPAGSVSLLPEPLISVPVPESVIPIPAPSAGFSSVQCPAQGVAPSPSPHAHAARTRKKTTRRTPHLLLPPMGDLDRGFEKPGNLESRSGEVTHAVSDSRPQVRAAGFR